MTVLKVKIVKFPGIIWSVSFKNAFLMISNILGIIQKLYNTKHFEHLHIR